jgi:glyoxylase-like metal-dependent hydrolase (beta-lactamase superfamily II)
MNIVVDTGFGGEIFTKLAQLGVQPDQVDAVLITHLHGDHIGGLQKDGKALFPKAKIYLASRELDYFTKTNVNQGAVAALAPYGSAVEAFDPPSLGMVRREILPGISAIAAYGHTPGHTIFMVESGSSRLLLIGDLLHVALVQFPRPEISASYDMDQKAAADTRSNVLGYAARNRIPVGGIHMVYPGVGSVETDGSGFRFVPAN